MGYSTVAESHSRLPQTPPDFTTSSSSSSSSFLSTRQNLHPQRQPPKDLYWPHPQPPISPPMSSHDQPLSSSVVKPLSPVPRPSSTDSARAGGMSSFAAASTSAPASAYADGPASSSSNSPRRNDAPPRPPVRETLPSLSSIFPLHPSPLDRHSPSLSYFPPPPPASKAATPPASQSQSSQQPLPQPPRSVYHDGHSPRPREHEYLDQQQAAAAAAARRHDARSTGGGYASTGSSRWGAHAEAGPADYSSHGEHKSYYADAPRYAHAPSPTDPRGPSASASDYHRRQHEQHQHQPPPPPYASHSHSSHQFSPPSPMGPSRSPVRGSSSSAASSMPMPLTPASSAYPEGVNIPKEGMGPKIWTGVDFLPQFMHASEVPGEGLCFFYDDGSHCKAVIDGESVNPYWGVTKAGKPRKRLAIACMTCREKKIKCDPEFPRCVQCEKFGRVCRFKNAPRGGNNASPGTTTSEPEGMIRPPPPPPPLESPRQMAYPARSMSSNSTSSSSRAGMRRASSPDRMDLATGALYKRPRTEYDHYTTTASRGRSPPPYGSHSPTMSADAPRSGGLPPAPWGSSSSHESRHDSRHEMHASSLPPYGGHMSSHGPQSHHQPHQSQSGYRRHPYDDYRHSQPTSPSSHTESSRMLLPPPRSEMELRMHNDDAAGRSWQANLYVQPPARRPGE